MSHLTDNAQFNQFLNTFLTWGCVYLVFWVISRFFVARKNTVIQARDIIKSVRNAVSQYQSRNKVTSIPQIQHTSAFLRKIKRKLINADKLLSIYQYEHSDIMALVQVRSTVGAMQKSCQAVINAVLDGNPDAYNEALQSIVSTCEDDIKLIDTIAEMVSRAQLLKV